MAYCCKCGKEIEEGMTYCSECEKPAIDVVENTESQKTDKKTKKKGKIAKLISDNKDNVVKGGAAAAVQFVVKKGLFALLTSILSAVIVFFTQNSFEEKFKDYHENFLIEKEPVMDEVLVSYKDFDFENIIGMGYSEELERTGLKEKTRALLKEAYSYSSEDADINRYHNQFIRVCEDLCEFYTAIEVYSQFESTMMPTSGVEDVTITLQLANVSNLGMEVLRVKTNLENNIIIYEEMRSEMFKKYGINENKYLF